MTSEGRVHILSMDGNSHRAQMLEVSGSRLGLLIDDRQVSAHVTADGKYRWVTVAGRTVRLTRSSSARPAAAGHPGSSELSAPMPGQVKAVNVNPGDHVARGQVLLVLEAMKMEIRLQAPFDGLVSSVDARVGQTVERDQVLVKLQQAPPAPS